MKTFGAILADARKATGKSQKEVASLVKKEDGQPISPQYLNDIERGRRNPPSEFIIVQFAALLNVPKDILCAAAGTFPSDLMKLAASHPERAEEAFQAFRKVMKPGK